ncbi:hypothetical protein A5819_001741 [Enterococcus sp. 7E2_DIV0204]|uniref:Uncharacterized protein n=2 Tax=Enterococcus TaxID=1350 RepID=A0ABZ2T5J8_9ENTE|nr:MULTISPECIES: hypothetical protein [unclassified Enterococcus]OTN89249.1 hypothetical protein A5819_001741 [Enterococcus sp. 7E2_DIV0204]OTO68099.1 hypothetical protein A5866_000294 [Enterococcus sp. 12C11_DIV0727]
MRIKKVLFISMLGVFLSLVVGTLKGNAELPGDPFADRAAGQQMSIWRGGHYYGYGIDGGRSSYEFGTNINISYDARKNAKIILELEPGTMGGFLPHKIGFYNTRSYNNVDRSIRAKESLVEINLYRRIKKADGSYTYCDPVSILPELLRDGKVSYYTNSGEFLGAPSTFINKIIIDLGERLNNGDVAISIPWIETASLGDTFYSGYPKSDATFTSRIIADGFSWHGVEHGEYDFTY